MTTKQDKIDAHQHRLRVAQQLIDTYTSGDLVRLRDSVAAFEKKYPGLFTQVDDLLQSLDGAMLAMAEIARAQEGKEG